MVGAFASISQFPVAPDINNNTTSQVQTNLLQKLFDINSKSYHAFLPHRHCLYIHPKSQLCLIIVEYLMGKTLAFFPHRLTRFVHCKGLSIYSK